MERLSRRGFFTSGAALATAFGFDLRLAAATTRAYKISRATQVKSICTFCSVGCAVVIHTVGERARNVKPTVAYVEGDADSPINRGALCSKGASLKAFITAERRLTSPLYRPPGAADWQPISWDEAIPKMALLIKSARDAGFEAKDAQGRTVNRLTNIAMIGSGAGTNEIGYLLSKFRFGLGILPCENLGASPAMTGAWPDVANAGLVLVMGGDPAESHPVGFRFVLAARLKRKAKLVCVDPRFSRTAAMADLHVSIRAGTDIAFLGGIIHYALATDQFQSAYVKRHTNAAFLVKDSFRFEDGRFSGWDEASQGYDKSAWQYELDGQGAAKTDPTLQHPRCVLQLMRKHYSRYQPEKVAQICGCSADEFRRAAELIISAHTADKPGTVICAPALTHCATILQLLMGNIGIPGGGVIQSSIGTGSWNHLPGQLKIPRPNHTKLDEYLKTDTSKFMVSLLKAYYGAAARRDNGFGYEWIPKAAETADHGWGSLFDRMYKGGMDGLISFGMDPLAHGPNTAKMMVALTKLKWMIAVENLETGAAALWRTKDPASNQTEVFLLPASCAAEQGGAFASSSRWLQWQDAALEPPGDVLPDQEILGRLFLEIRKLYADAGGAAPEQVLNMSWDYARPSRPSPGEVAREINGRELTTGKQLGGSGELKADGSTMSGNWMCTGSWTEAGNMMARRGQDEWSWSWPAHRRTFDLFAPELAEGPLPEHYEPAESPVENPLHPQVSASPVAKKFESALDKYGAPDKFPYVGITYRLGDAPAHVVVELPEALARQKGIKPGDLVRVSSARGSVEGQALVTRRLKANHVGLPIHRNSGSLINNLTASVYDPNTGAPEGKGFLVNLEKV